MDQIPESKMDEWEEELEQYEDALALKKKREIHCSPPAACDLCKQDLKAKRYFVDGALRGSASWANMCAKCFRAHGDEIGWGKGQLYLKQKNGDWLQVAGFRPKN
jgi:hypothetical protein